MTSSRPQPDGPNRYIGKALARPGAKRLLAGRGRYTDDVSPARLLHVAFARSPYAHAAIGAIDVAAAAAMPGVHRVVTGPELAALCTPWVGTLTHFKGMKSPPQVPLAIDRAVWPGQAVVAVLAETRAQAEDAVEVVDIAFDMLDPVTDIDAARAPGTTLVDPALADNIAFRAVIESFGRPQVETWLPLDVSLGAAATRVALSEETRQIGPNEDLGQLRETEQVRGRDIAGHPGVLATLVGLEPATWRLTRFTLQAERADAQSGTEVAHLAAPGLAALRNL